MSDQTHLSPVSLSSHQREFDIVIFGASGFVGYYAIKDLYTSIRDNAKEYSTLKWAVAGRTLAKLEQTLSDLEDELQVDLSTIPRIVADVSVPETVSSMVSRTRVLLNAAGPYMELGRAVVDACLSSGTHHLDVSAELQFIELTQVECHQEAINSEALVISACGWASLIPEMAVALARKHFDGTLHSVETFLDIKVGKHVS